MSGARGRRPGGGGVSRLGRRRRIPAALPDVRGRQLHPDGRRDIAVRMTAGDVSEARAVDTTTSSGRLLSARELQAIRGSVIEADEAISDDVAFSARVGATRGE